MRRAGAEDGSSERTLNDMLECEREGGHSRRALESAARHSSTQLLRVGDLQDASCSSNELEQNCEPC